MTHTYYRTTRTHSPIRSLDKKLNTFPADEQPTVRVAIGDVTATPLPPLCSCREYVGDDPDCKEHGKKAVR
jgi:hypothetical protein